MTKLLALAICSVVGSAVGLGATGCSPRMSVGYDATAHVRGPLANLQTISRVEAVTGSDMPAPPEGRNYSLGIGFGDKRLNIGARVSANNISGSTLAIDGAQYMSASGALDVRYNVLRFKNFATGIQLAPTRTLLIDSTGGTHSWGSGLRYGGGVSFSLVGFSIFADAYQEKLIFIEGPAEGNSTRTGVTLGLAFQP
jgi:hypothetical protein